MMGVERVALYTVVHPGAVPYLGAWYASVEGQTDAGFDLWVSVDGMEVEDVVRAMGGRAKPRAIWLRAAEGASPSAIRAHAIELMTGEYDAVVFADSDDLLHPSRIAAARSALERDDVAACALRIIDQAGRDLQRTFGAEGVADASAMLPRYNVFGLSNSAYRSDVLRSCLPIPPACVASDWLMATRAWAMGATLAFDTTPRMSYRQYGSNTAQVVPPFTVQHVRKATTCVADHYRYVLESGWPLPDHVRGELRAARARVECFRRAIANEHTLTEYVDALNDLAPRYVWWWCVAHPELEALWTT
ncbi:MAG TPA: hypothetical protein VFJ96_09785 [Gemmatimonadaceae bacterium]|nr:hypothetical protein [Gemmatimonadaceae bacterium]